MTQHIELKRTLSLVQITFYGLGTILGAGIYVLVGKVAGDAGMYAPVSFVVAAVLAVLTGLSYAELCARYPKSAGVAFYTHQGFGRQHLSVTAGFLIILTGLVSAATLVNGFVGYLQVFVAAPDWLVITLLVLALGALAAWGIDESVFAASAITLIEPPSRTCFNPHPLRGADATFSTPEQFWAWVVSILTRSEERVQPAMRLGCAKF